MHGKLSRIIVDPRSAGQPVEGFGVNINPVGHWRDGSLAPILDMLVDELGATLFRLDPFGKSDWVGQSGPGSLNRQTYEKAYRSSEFKDAWATARYLQSKGCTILLNVSGPVPNWMCHEDGVTLTEADQYVEMLLSLARWAVTEEGLTVPYFGPLNETDIGPPEGPFASPPMAYEVVTRLRKQLDESGLGETKLVSFDQARWNCEYLDELKQHDIAESPVQVLGMHCYHDDADYETVRVAKEKSGLGRASWWLTEYGDLDGTGERELDVALASTRRLLRGLGAGVNAGIFWDAYDNWHRHENGWTIYGLLRTAVQGPIYRYTKKRRYFAAQQVYRYVRPGWNRVACRGGDDLLATAFASGNGDITVIGINPFNERVLIQLEVADGQGARSESLVPAELGVFATDEELSCDQICASAFSGWAEEMIPPRSVFTITVTRKQKAGAA